MACSTAPADQGIPVAAQIAQDCKQVQCDGNGGIEIVDVGDDFEDDNNECTTDACFAGSPTHTPVDVHTGCTTPSNGFCDATGTCVECVYGSDCASLVCSASGACLPAQCGDNAKNGTETDIDCGGASCSPCDTGLACLVAMDCESSVCAGNTCAAPDCSDGVKNGTETDLDCGGLSCTGCSLGQECLLDLDCASASCFQLQCVQCQPGASQLCSYNGPAGTAGVGACQAGTQVCDAAGSGFGGCNGEVQPQAEDCSSLTDQNCDGVVGYFPGCHIWSKQTGNSNTQYARNVAVDAQDNLVFVENFTGTLSNAISVTSVGLQDSLVAKYSPEGALLFLKRFGMTGSSHSVTSSAIDGLGNIFFGGKIETSPVDFGCGLVNGLKDRSYLAKLDTNGDCVFSKGFTGGAGVGLSTTVYDVATDAAGNLLAYAGGSTSMDFGCGAFSSGIGKLDAQGNCLWTRGGGGTGAIAVDSVGSAFVAGSFAGVTDFSPNAQTLTSAGGADAFVVKFDSAGNYLWGRAIGSSGNQGATDVAVDSLGNAIITGSYQGTIDFGTGAHVSAGVDDAFVAKLDGATGSCVWSISFGDASFQQGRSMAVDPANDIFLTGSISGTVDFGGGPIATGGGNDMFVAKFEGATGALGWAQVFGDSGDQWGEGIASDSSGVPVVVGYFGGSMDLGSGLAPMDAGAGYDMFFAKLGN